MVLDGAGWCDLLNGAGVEIGDMGNIVKVSRRRFI
jgi:hypothetical protein